jgi:hypothetical protein
VGLAMLGKSLTGAYNPSAGRAEQYVLDPEMTSLYY